MKRHPTRAEKKIHYTFICFPDNIEMRSRIAAVTSMLVAPGKVNIELVFFSLIFAENLLISD